MLLLPLALSKTQDDKGRVRWTLFGGSEQGPAKAFWKGFYTAPRREVPREWSEGFIRRLLAAAYGEKPEALADLRKAGFRVYTNPAAALAALVERRAAAQMDRALSLGKGLAPRRPLPA